jgi:hypothetical protein
VKRLGGKRIELRSRCVCFNLLELVACVVVSRKCTAIRVYRFEWMHYMHTLRCGEQLNGVVAMNTGKRCMETTSVGSNRMNGTTNTYRLLC